MAHKIDDYNCYDNVEHANVGGIDLICDTYNCITAARMQLQTGAICEGNIASFLENGAKRIEIDKPIRELSDLKPSDLENTTSVFICENALGGLSAIARLDMQDNLFEAYNNVVTDYAVVDEEKYSEIIDNYLEESQMDIISHIVRNIDKYCGEGEEDELEEKLEQYGLSISEVLSEKDNWDMIKFDYVETETDSWFIHDLKSAVDCAVDQCREKLEELQNHSPQM